MSYNQELKEFLSDLASDSPTPGGGTASAVSGAMGLSLLAMVLGVYVRKVKEEERVILVREKIEELKRRSNELLELADLDAIAFDEVMEAYKLPKLTEEQKNQRAEKVQQALKNATLSPLNILKKISEAYDIVQSISDNSSTSTLSDLLEGLCLLEAGLKGALYNIDINSSTIMDRLFVESVHIESRNIYNKFLELLLELREANEKKLL